MRRTGLAIVMLALVALPRLAAAAVVVAEPTGDAAPAFLAELKASLESVVSEVAPDIDAELRSSAAFTDAGAELVVELVLNDGSDLIRETRTASRASALSQARAMARAAIRELFAPMPESTIASQTNAAPQAESAKPRPRERYSRRIALASSLVPTLLFLAGGWAVGFIDPPELLIFASLPAMTLTVTFAPAIGYFYLGKWKHALLLSGVRLLLGGIAITSAMMGAAERSSSYEAHCNEEERPSSCDNQYASGGIIVGIVFAVLFSGVALVDAAFVGRAADRANAEWREKNKPQIQVAPIAWSSGNGDSSFGLAVSGSF